MPPDVRPVFWGVGNPSIGNPAIRVQAENPERSFQGLTVAQFDLVTPLDQVSHHGWFNLRRADGVPVLCIQPSTGFQLDDCAENGDQ